MLEEAGDRGALWVNAPAMYRKFAVRIELHSEKPPVPDWCEDAVEVSYRVGGQPLEMGSFETSQSEPWRPGASRCRGELPAESDGVGVLVELRARTSLVRR